MDQKDITRVDLKRRLTIAEFTPMTKVSEFFELGLNKLLSIADLISMGKRSSWFGIPPQGGRVLCRVIKQKNLV